VARREGFLSVIAAELRGIKSGRRDLRKFGVTMGVAVAALGGLFLWRGRGEPLAFFLVAAGFLVFALALPAALRPVQRAWMAFAVVLGWMMTRVILAVVFYVGVTPIALIARLVGKRFLELGFEPERRSYWERRPAPDRGRERYLNQF
jgi:hypothetical protein